MYNKGKIKVQSSQTKKSNPYSKDMIYDPRGQRAHPGQNTRIPGGDITMQGVNYPVMGVANNGQSIMMMPGGEYNFPGADYVDEFPMMQDGGQIVTVYDGRKQRTLNTNSEEYKKLYKEDMNFRNRGLSRFVYAGGGDIINPVQPVNPPANDFVDVYEGGEGWDAYQSQKAVTEQDAMYQSIYDQFDANKGYTNYNSNAKGIPGMEMPDGSKGYRSYDYDPSKLDPYSIKGVDRIGSYTGTAGRDNTHGKFVMPNRTMLTNPVNYRIVDSPDVAAQKAQTQYYEDRGIIGFKNIGNNNAVAGDDNYDPQPIYKGEEIPTDGSHVRLGAKGTFPSFQEGGENIDEDLINNDMNNLDKFVYQDGGQGQEQMAPAPQQEAAFTEQDQQVFGGFMETLPPEIQQAGEVLIEIWMQLGKPPEASQEDVQIIGEALSSMQQEQPQQQMPPEAMAQQQDMQQQGPPQGMPPEMAQQGMPPEMMPPGMMQFGGQAYAQNGIKSQGPISGSINLNPTGGYDHVSDDSGNQFEIPNRFQDKNMHYRINPDDSQKRFFKTHEDRMSNFKRAFTPKDKRTPFVQQGVYSFQNGGGYNPSAGQSYITDGVPNTTHGYMGSIGEIGDAVNQQYDPMPQRMDMIPAGNIDQGSPSLNYTDPDTRAFNRYAEGMVGAGRKERNRLGEEFNNALNYQDGGGFEEMELTDAEIASLRSQGYQVDEF